MNVFSSPRFVISLPGVFQRPLAIFLCLFFLSTSFDLAHVLFFAFKIKLTNLVSFAFFLVAFFHSFYGRLPREILFPTLLILGSMLISSVFSVNLPVCFSFVLFFLFNFLFYFLSCFCSFFIFSLETVLFCYRVSFWIVGFYAIAQFVGSLVGIDLPGVSQKIYRIARAQAFFYEPSYYALYMTPFTMFYNARYVLSKMKNGGFSQIVFPNLFLLVSASSGCFFSYLFLFFAIFVFRFLGVVEKFKISFVRVFKFGCCFFFLFNAPLISSGILKIIYRNGLASTVSPRWDGIVKYWNLFLEHPLIGVGLGSGPSYLLLEKRGFIDRLDPTVLDKEQAMNVTTEILGSLGIFGAVAFFFFFYVLIRTFRKALRLKELKGEERERLIALAVSVFVMFGTLQFSQSIMRAYVWVHVGIFFGYAHFLLRRASRIPLTSGIIF